jgi:prepilin-type N-terminal cleavage/methylation domain-containing protein
MGERTGICTNWRARPGGGAGFTLIELIAVTVLIGILAMIAATPLMQGLMARKEVADDLDAIGKLRYATERISREIRQIKYDTTNGYLLTLQSASYPSTSPSYPGLSIQSSNGICFTRWGASGSTSPAVVISLVSSSVQVAYTASCPPTTASNLLDNVLALKLDFLGIDSTTGAVTAPKLADGASFYTNIRFVDITLTLNQTGKSLSQRTRVALRNGAGP